MKKNYSEKEIENAVCTIAAEHRNEYSDEKFFRKLIGLSKLAGTKVIRSVVETALILYYTFKADTTPAKARLIIVSALIYLIVPIDLIPDTIPLIGFTDDLAALMAALKAVATNVTPEIRSAARNETNRMMH